MGEVELRRLEYRTAAEVCRRYGPTDEARALLSDGLGSAAFLTRLVEAGRDEDAEAFLAHALPRREAVWWGCLCAREANGGAAPAGPAGEALAAAERWAASPGDVNRRKAFAASEAAGLEEPAAVVALAVFLSGGSLAPPGLPEAKPAEHLTAVTLLAALKLAALKGPGGADAAPATHRRFVALGLDVARAASRWKDPL